jgi:hypothetical protein
VEALRSPPFDPGLLYMISGSQAIVRTCRTLVTACHCDSSVQNVKRTDPLPIIRTTDSDRSRGDNNHRKGSKVFILSWPRFTSLLTLGGSLLAALRRSIHLLDRAPPALPSSSLAELEFVGPFLRRREYNTATDGFRVRPAELASWSSWSGVLWREWELAKGRDHARAERFQRTPMTGMTGANKEDSDEVSPLALLRLVGR